MTNTIIQLAYLVATFASVASGLPQIKQLLITKQSDELSLKTWISWTTCQCVALLYAISLGAIPYIIANVAWIIFYLYMVFLIIKYRPRTQPAPVKVETTEQPVTNTTS